MKELQSWNLVPLLAVLFSCLVLLLGYAKSALVTETYSLDSGIHCRKCPTGTLVVADCHDDLEEPVCASCPKHHFSDAPNGKKYCTLCRSSCPKYGKQVQDCTNRTNRICTCQPGYHRYPLDNIDQHFDFECEIHSKCRKGYGEVYQGNFTHDTFCEKCIEGTEFINSTDSDHPKCQKCTTCSPGSVLRHCSLLNDTKCADNSTAIQNSTSIPEIDSQGANTGGPSDGEIGGIVVGVVLVGVLLAIGVYICVRRRKTKGRQQRTPQGGQNRSSTEDETEMEANGNLLPEPSGDLSNEFIQLKVFTFLSKNLGNEWQQFILGLRGWPDPNRVNAIIDHKKEEEKHSVPNQIHGCLREWQKECPGFVTKENIIEALMRVELNELIESLPTEHVNDSASNGI